MQAVRGELNDYAHAYSHPTGGSNKMAKSVDVAQTAAAIYMVKVATENMRNQFGSFLTVFSDVG